MEGDERKGGGGEEFELRIYFQQLVLSTKDPSRRYTDNNQAN